MGAVSTYRQHDPDIFASVEATHIVHAPMSALQFARYAYMRQEERRREQNAQRLQARYRKFAASSPFASSYGGPGASESGQVYRTFSLAACTFVFPDEVPRPFKFQMRAAVAAQGAVDESGRERKPESSESEVNARESTRAEADESARVDGSTRAEADESARVDGSRVEVESVAAPGRESARSSVYGGGAASIILTSSDSVEESVLADGDLDRAYAQALARAVRRLKTEMPQCLRYDQELATHSPKFHLLLGHLRTDPGIALIYSQFRRAEGIGLLSAALDADGWSELRLTRRESDGAWLYSRSPSDSGTKRYLVLRTEDDPERTRLLLHAFNNELDELPRATRESLPATTNLRGELVRAILITASGAEGLSLKNVRQVHMLESFWNHNRIDQVVGRAVRAKSHEALPQDERNVRVFLYLATLTDAQRRDFAVMQYDQGLTSDQYVHSVAMRKKTLVDQAMGLVEAASVDCAVHRDPTRCFALPRAAMAHGQTYRTLNFADDLDDAAFTRRMSRLVAVQMGDAKYYMDERSGALYDYTKLKEDNALVRVGQIDVGAAAAAQR